MNEVRIQYFGHSCFRVSTPVGSAVFDPYEKGSVPGLRLPEGIEADDIFCSHQHADHNAAKEIRPTGRPCPFRMSFLEVPHDHHGGKHRGMSRISFLETEGLTIAHLGDLGRLPEDMEYDLLAKADVVLLPCAGYYTIDSREAAEIIQHLKKPSLKILMHFRDGDRGYDVQEDITDIQKNIPGIERLNQTDISVSFGNVPDRIITLQPEQ